MSEIVERNIRNETIVTRLKYRYMGREPTIYNLRVVFSELGLSDLYQPVLGENIPMELRKCWALTEVFPLLRYQGVNPKSAF